MNDRYLRFLDKLNALPAAEKLSQAYVDGVDQPIQSIIVCNSSIAPSGLCSLSEWVARVSTGYYQALASPTGIIRSLPDPDFEQNEVKPLKLSRLCSTRGTVHAVYGLATGTTRKTRRLPRLPIYKFLRRVQNLLLSREWTGCCY